MKSIIKDYIFDFSIPSSYSRGMDYYKSGKVLSVKKSDNKFIAEVQGIEKYKVELIIRTDSLRFHCSCPYDYEGICKHCVALGFEIINGGYELENWNYESTNKEKEHSQKVDELINQASNKEKFDFLRQLLLESENNLERFKTHIKGQLEVEENIDISDLNAEIKEIIKNMALNDVNRLHGYGESGFLNGFDEILTTKLDAKLSKIKEYLDKDNIIDAWKYLLAGYESILILDDNAINDPYDIFYGEITGEIQNIWKMEYLQRILDYLEENETSHEVNQRLIEIFTDRIKLSFNDMKYNLKIFFPIILKLITDPNIALFLRGRLQKNGYESNADEIILKITKILEDNKQWELKALKFYQKNPKISQKLLNYYQENGSINKYKKVARIIFKKFPDKFDQQIYLYLKNKEKSKFIKDVLKYYLKRTGNIKLFRELKQRFGRKEAEDFIRGIGGKRKDTRFYIHLLEEEKRYGEILKILKNNINHPSLDYMAKPIINKYPEQCLSLLKEKVSKFLKNNTGRKNYRQSIHWLHLMNSVKKGKYKKEVSKYIKSILEKYSRRPAFHDEMEKAGLKS